MLQQPDLVNTIKRHQYRISDPLEDSSKDYQLNMNNSLQLSPSHTNVLNLIYNSQAASPANMTRKDAGQRNTGPAVFLAPVKPFSTDSNQNPISDVFDPIQAPRSAHWNCCQCSQGNYPRSTFCMSCDHPVCDICGRLEC